MGADMEKAAAGPIKRYRRFHGYDYGRGARLFLTTGLAGRVPVLGHVEWVGDGGARVVLSEAGDAVRKALLETPRFVPAVALERYVVMPDHVHLLVRLRAGEAAPLKALGRFMAGFKRVAAKEAGIRWEEGYHDRICLGREFRGHVEAYMDLNPLKWALMHLPRPGGGAAGRASAACHVREPLEAGVLEDRDYWRGLGALELLEGRLCAVRVSRRVERVPAELLERFRRGIGQGWVFVSTLLSVGERELFGFLSGNGGRMVSVKERGLGWVYRPDIRETPLLAEGRLAVLGLGGAGGGRVGGARGGRLTAGHQEVTRAGSLLLNAKIAEMARVSGGCALHVTPEGLHRVS